MVVECAKGFGEEVGIGGGSIMGKMDDYEQFDHKIYNRQQGLGVDGWQKTAVFTDNGIVVTTSLSYFTLMEFVCNGREYNRRWEHGFATRTLTTLAKRFAADVVLSQHGGNDD